MQNQNIVIFASIEPLLELVATNSLGHFLSSNQDIGFGVTDYIALELTHNDKLPSTAILSAFLTGSSLNLVVHETSVGRMFKQACMSWEVFNTIESRQKFFSASEHPNPVHPTLNLDHAATDSLIRFYQETPKGFTVIIIVDKAYLGGGRKFHVRNVYVMTLLSLMQELGD